MSEAARAFHAAHRGAADRAVDMGTVLEKHIELLAEQDADIRSFKHGDVVEGTVVRIDRDEILRKPGRLDPDEWRLMQSHTTRGRAIGPPE